MKKKNILAICISVGVLVALVLVCAMVFTLHNISFQQTSVIRALEVSHLYSGGNTVESVQEKLLTDAEFNKGGNLLFMKFDKNIQNIESKNPFVKVEKIVRRFPNKITVYYTEREPVALIHTSIDDAYYLIDADMKVLAYVTDTSLYSVPVIEDGKTYSSNLGSFINDTTLKLKINAISDGAYNAYGEKDAIMEDVLKDVVKIQFTTVYEDGVADGSRVIVTFNKKEGTHKVVATILSSNTALKDKCAYLWKVFFTNLSQQDYSVDSTVVVYQNSTTKKIIVADTTDSSANQYEIIDD